MSKGLKVSAQKSALHRKVAGLLREIYPKFTVKEEVSVSVDVSGRPSTLFLDIFVSDLNLAIECHGRQHFEFIPHFHETRSSFAQAQARDQAKAQTLIDSGYSFLVVRYDEEKSLTRKSLMRKIIQSLEKSHA